MARKLISITVDTTYCQTTYFAGQYFNPSGAVVTETFGHGSKWDWGEAIGSGFMGMAAGILSYGAGATSSLAFGSNIVASFVCKQGVKWIFTFPLQFAEGMLIDYLS